jgi:ankyrin repeat protein
MPDRELPVRPNLEQYKKQAKELARNASANDPVAIARIQKHHPRHPAPAGAPGLVTGVPSDRSSSLGWSDTRDYPTSGNRISLTDAQLVIAREHGYESWPKFAAHIRTLNLESSVQGLEDPVAAFIRAACVPRNDSHISGTPEEAELILARYPRVARANIYTAAIRADEAGVREFLSRNPASATAKGGPYEWDALTHLCFSRYLRLDKSRSDAFVRTARALLESGAGANTGWYEMIDHPNPRPLLESAIYGAAGIAHHEGLTRLLLEFGADPNDEETPYHAAEGYDLAAVKALLESGRLNATSLTTLLLRKADWHDTEGIRLLLAGGADPNDMTRWGNTALLHAMTRDNCLENISLLLDHGANPTLRNHLGLSAAEIAAHRGRSDVLRFLQDRGIDCGLEGVHRLIAACATADHAKIGELTSEQPQLIPMLIANGGKLLAEFSGNGNTEGVQCLLDLGVPVDALFREGDIYWDLARDSTALHSAAWRAWPNTVKLLIARGAPVNAKDGKGRTPLMLAVKACVDSYWKWRRTPEPVDALLKAGATPEGIEIPCGYDEVDELLRAATSDM